MWTLIYFGATALAIAGGAALVAFVFSLGGAPFGRTWAIVALLLLVFPLGWIGIVELRSYWRRKRDG